MKQLELFKKSFTLEEAEKFRKAWAKVTEAAQDLCCPHCSEKGCPTDAVFDELLEDDKAFGLAPVFMAHNPNFRFRRAEFAFLTLRGFKVGEEFKLLKATAYAIEILPKMRKNRENTTAMRQFLSTVGTGTNWGRQPLGEA